jgi:hypothetical protein
MTNGIFSPNAALPIKIEKGRTISPALLVKNLRVHRNHIMVTPVLKDVPLDLWWNI